jgi:hypothetical protein
MKYKIYFIMIIILILISPLVFTQTNDDSDNENDDDTIENDDTETDEDYFGTGTGLDYKDKHNFLRDEMFLEDLVDYPYKYAISEEVEEKESDFLIVKDDPFTPDSKVIYQKPIIYYYKKWNFYLDYGVEEIKPDDIKYYNNYYTAYFSSTNGKLIKVEKYNIVIKMLYIYNDIEKPRYIINFDINQFEEFLYDENGLLIRKNIYVNGNLTRYKTYNYLNYRIVQLERSYKYDGTPHGKWIEYNSNGNKVEEIKWYNGLEKYRIVYLYNNTGIEIERRFYLPDINSNEIVMLKYWVRNEDKIYYYNHKENKISWLEFMNLNRIK